MFGESFSLIDFQEAFLLRFVLHFILLIVLQNCGYLIVVGLFLIFLFLYFVMSHFDMKFVVAATA